MDEMFTLIHPQFVDKPIGLSYLSNTEKGKLKGISKLAREDMFERYNNTIEITRDTSQYTDSKTIGITVCSYCGRPIRAIKNSWLSRFLSGFTTYGIFCGNNQCEYYLKFIPRSTGTKLTNIAFIPELIFTTTNPLKTNEGQEVE